MLLVYCEHITPRVEYIFRFMLHTLCGFNVAFTADETRYRLHEGLTLNYSEKKLKEADVEIRPNGLLFLESIVDCEATAKETSTGVQLFLNAAGVDASCFDPFATAFFLLTRYEEYLPFMPDQYNRFEAASSVLFTYKLLHRPLINEWAEALQKTFSKAHISVTSRNTFTCIITIDIDQAFAFMHRGFLKNLGAFVKNTLHLKTSFLGSQIKSWISKEDPYDTFAYMEQMQQTTGLPFLYFINAGTETIYDKNLPVSNQAFKSLLNKIKKHAQIGLHPSYFSNISPEKVAQEKAALEQPIGQPILHSRQHYLKLYFPKTYQNLIALGITEDYTMGYASQPGFRAGTCTPFPWYDLERNCITELTVFPVTYMEGTFGEDLALSPEDALTEMKKLIDTVRRYNGCFIPIWHNHTVNNRFFWKGWQAIFKESLHYIINK